MAAGNTVVLKPSELAPHVAEATELLFRKYLDPNAYICVNGGVKVAVRATQAKADLIVFTGSTEKGKLVAKAAAENLVPVMLELGGKSPMIVDKSVDLEYAAAKAAQHSFFNSGQVCIRADYQIVHQSILDEFLKKVVHYAEQMTQGGKLQTFTGKVINDPSTQRLCDLLNPEDHKGKVIYGNQNAFADRKLTPTIVVNPDLNSGMMKDEIFGPIMPVVTFSRIEEAIALINSKAKPLAVYYYGQNSLDNENLMKVKTQTYSGSFLVNDCTLQYMNNDMGFGGVGGSGMGRIHGK